jgi:hypothetical protein
MPPGSKTNLLNRLRNVLCVFYLILAVLSEGYTVVSIALDRFVPAWYRTLGWFLLVLPCALALGLLLLYANRRRLALYLSVASLSLYAVLVCLDTHRGPAVRGDWIFEVIWIAFCAGGIVAAKSLMSRPMPMNPTDVQERSVLSG